MSEENVTMKEEDPAHDDSESGEPSNSTGADPFFGRAPVRVIVCAVAREDVCPVEVRRDDIISKFKLIVVGNSQQSWRS